MDKRSTGISESRKAMYYGGIALGIVGLLVFLSTFLMVGNFDHSVGSFAARSVLGMVLMIVGGAVQRAGARGLAGSGVILDPQQARRDVEPWSRMAGGVLSDALGEVDLRGEPRSKPEVKLRCRSCQALNDETAKFCGQCGAAL